MVTSEEGGTGVLELGHKVRERWGCWEWIAGVGRADLPFLEIRAWFSLSLTLSHTHCAASNLLLSRILVSPANGGRPTAATSTSRHPLLGVRNPLGSQPDQPPIAVVICTCESQKTHG
ncbi:hypothetical protein AAHA92_21909 [Salvia divinorum]|uniref:Uncharacterized protein n=1 Tax=Salvia divinorum TaxID=28513 RepID=A0ABD1GQ28_SALDI